MKVRMTRKGNVRITLTRDKALQLTSLTGDERGDQMADLHDKLSDLLNLDFSGDLVFQQKGEWEHKNNAMWWKPFTGSNQETQR
jgi:hypothetical protein